MVGSQPSQVLLTYLDVGGVFDNVDLTAVAGMAQHPGPATYPVNVLVRFVTSGHLSSYVNHVSHVSSYVNHCLISPFQERLHQLAAPHPPSELQTMHK